MQGSNRVLRQRLLFPALLVLVLHAGCSRSGSFVEDFHARRIDTSRWIVSDGWNNGPWHGCSWSAKNVSQTPGRLRIVVNDTPLKDRKFSCGEIQSRSFHGHGVYEVRLRAGSGSGVVAAFFTFAGPAHRKPHDEIDFEFLGKSAGEVQLNFFRDGKGGHEKMIPLGFDATAQAHDYAFVWTKDSVRWFVDGRQVHETRNEVPVAAGKIYLNVWNGGPKLDEWLGPLRYPGSPIAIEVERVAFTAEGSKCQFPGSLACTVAEPVDARASGSRP